jgi:hypothetical protein
MHYCNPQVGHARVPRKESPAGGEGTGETEELTGRADRKSLHGICAPNDDLGLDRKTAVREETAKGYEEELMLRSIRKKLLRRGGVVALAAALVLAPALAAASTSTAQAAQIQICNNFNVRLCFNVRGGSHTLNTPITAYTPNDQNGTFIYEPLKQMCNGTGHVIVTAGGGCPFYVGSGLNSQYDGAAIVSLSDYGAAPTRCAGTVSDGTGSMLEQPCPGQDGTGGGGHGVLWVLKSVHDATNGGGTLTEIINIRQTNDTHNGSGYEVCNFGQKSSTLWTNWADNGNPDSGGCHWKESQF